MSNEYVRRGGFLRRSLPDQEPGQLPALGPVILLEGRHSNSPVHRGGGPQPVTHADGVHVVNRLDVQNIPKAFN